MASAVGVSAATGCAAPLVSTCGTSTASAGLAGLLVGFCFLATLVAFLAFALPAGLLGALAGIVALTAPSSLVNSASTMRQPLGVIVNLLRYGLTPPMTCRSATPMVTIDGTLTPKALLCCVLPPKAALNSASVQPQSRNSKMI